MPDDTPVDARSETEPRRFRSIFLFARLGVTLIFLGLTVLVAKPFLASLTWALVLTVIFVTPHRFLEARCGPSLAAGVSVALIALLIVAPLLLVSQRLIAEAIAGADYIQRQVASGQWSAVTAGDPWLQRLAAWIGNNLDVKALVERLATLLTNTGASVIKQSTGQLITLVFAFYLLFFFLRDRRDGLDALARLSPFSAAETAKLFVRVRDTINATIYGTLAVAALQGALGGLMFWWLGFPSPVLWAVIMGLLCVVPVLGSFVVWIPAAIFLALEGRWGDAILLAGWGGLVIASIDNLVRPLLVSEGLRLHTGAAFIGMLGGLQLFSASGLILGPVVLTSTAQIMEFWRRRQRLAREL